jgi:glycolate oxidase iron-sulfur subunit
MPKTPEDNAGAMKVGGGHAPEGIERAAADELLRCNRCGFCVESCPTYRATFHELFVARGRNRLAGKALDGEVEIDDELAEPLFQCLLCEACTNVCRSSVKTAEAMVAARHGYWKAKGRPAAMRMVFDRLLPNPRLMARVMKLLATGKRSGLSTLARRLGLLRWINARLEGAEGLVETMPSTFLRERLAGMGFERSREGEETTMVWRRKEGADGPRIAYFIGCGTNFQIPDAGEAAMRVLHAGGCEIVVAEHVCCGLPPYSYGDLEAAEVLIERNVRTLGALGCDYIVAECGSCTSFLRKYGQLGGEEGKALAEKVRDFTEIAAGLEVPKLRDPMRVTYHDPCHLVRGAGVRDEPRELLRRAGCELVELNEADWCCGGAGTYNIMHPELSLAILERKMRNIAETGVEVVATACPSCIIQLRYGARRFADVLGGRKIEVLHVAEVLARAAEDEASEMADEGAMCQT